MSIEDKIWILAHSSNPEDKREWAVLYWKSQGLKHEEIAEKFDYSNHWVQRYTTRAYKRFEVPPELNKYEKFQYLEDNVFPLMRKFITNEPDTIKELPPPPDSEPEIIDDSEPFIDVTSKSVEPFKPAIIVPPPPPKPTDPWKTFRRVFFAVVSLVVLLGITYFAYTLGSKTPPQIVVITATPVPATETPVPTATSAIPTDTLVPTDTPTTIPTNTQEPTITPVPTEFVPPADGVLFQDNFDSGDLSAWNQNSGQWIVLDGKLTKLYDDKNYDYQWISLGRPEWKNYILSIDVYQPYSNNFVIAVRNKSSKSQLIGLNVNHEDINLVLVSDNYQENSLISASTEVEIPLDSKVNIQLEVQGDTYILTSNGREVQRVTLPGYESGGISIGSVCFQESYGCTKFDNIKVTYLP